jgi:hypothetical protein
MTSPQAAQPLTGPPGSPAVILVTGIQAAGKSTVAQLVLLVGTGIWPQFDDRFGSG